MVPTLGRCRLECRTAPEMDLSKLSARELVQFCLESGDEAAWTEFVRRYQPIIAEVVTKSVFRRMNRISSLSDDLIQNTYVKLCVDNFKILRRFNFQHEDALLNFLKMLARKAVDDYFRFCCSNRGSSNEGMETVNATISVNTCFTDE